MPAFDSSLSITFLPENNHFFIGQILFFFALLSFTISIFALSHFVGQLLAKIPIYGDFCSEIYWSGSRTGFFLDPVCGPGKIFKKLKIKPIIDQSSISQYFSNPDQSLAGPKRIWTYPVRNLVWIFWTFRKSRPIWNCHFQFPLFFESGSKSGPVRIIGGIKFRTIYRTKNNPSSKIQTS